MGLPDPFPRLYAILDVDVTDAAGLRPLTVLAIWLDAGVRLIQLRAKTLASGPMLELADQARRLANAAGATFIVNDRADIARLAGADGLHIGQDDLPPREARQIVGDAAIVGLSTHSLAQLDVAAREPVSYLAIGPVFVTRTKARSLDAAVGLAGVRAAVDHARAACLPVVAIGGITLADAPAVVGAGAQAVAVISDLLDGDPRTRAEAYMKVLGP